MITWEQYFYRKHSREELERWARRLRYFRFVRAVGGHANDFDALVLRLRCQGDTAELLVRLGATGGVGTRMCFGQLAFVADCEAYVEVSLSGQKGGGWPEVTDANVEAAALIEAQLASLVDRVIDPPFDSERCLCPKWYPEVWEPPAAKPDPGP